MASRLTASPSQRRAVPQAWEITKQTTCFDLRGWRQYLAHTRSYTAMRFICEMTLLAWFLKTLVTLPISLTVLLIYGDPAVWQNPQQAAFAARPLANAMLALAIAPLFETMLGQWGPIATVGQWTSRPQPALAAATLFFAGLHLVSWDVTIVIATLPVGFVLAWSFLVWQRRSLLHALGMTAAIHAFHNAIALCLLFW